MPLQLVHESKLPLLHVRERVCVSLEHAPGGLSSSNLVRLCDLDSPCLWLPQPALQLEWP